MVRKLGSVPRACHAAVRRVLWLEDEITSCASDELDTLDGVMRVLEAAYATLEQTALRAPRAHPLRVAALRMVGARRTWLAVAAEARTGVEDLEREATVELDAARVALRVVYGGGVSSNGAVHGLSPSAPAGEDAGSLGEADASTRRAGEPVASNVVSLAERRLRRTS